MAGRGQRLSQDATARLRFPGLPENTIMCCGLSAGQCWLLRHHIYPVRSVPSARSRASLSAVQGQRRPQPKELGSAALGVSFLFQGGRGGQPAGAVHRWREALLEQSSSVDGALLKEAQVRHCQAPVKRTLLSVSLGPSRFLPSFSSSRFREHPAHNPAASRAWNQALAASELHSLLLGVPSCRPPQLQSQKEERGSSFQSRTWSCPCSTKLAPGRQHASSPPPDVVCGRSISPLPCCGTGDLHTPRCLTPGRTGPLWGSAPASSRRS